MNIFNFIKKIIFLAIFLAIISFSVIMYFLWKFSPELPSYSDLKNYNPNLASNMTETGMPGASLRVWKDYFRNAKIYGGDIDKDILFEEGRIKTFYVDQLDTSSINSMWKNINLEDFDIIIDDGLHTPEANLNFFFNSFDKLKNNGIYIIEDVKNKHLSYIQEKLKDYDTEIVSLSNKFINAYGSNLIVIRKT